MCYKRLIWSVCVIVFLSETVTAHPPAPQYAFRVSFTDKKGTVSISNPLVFLSSRSMARRSRLSIPVDSSDLPVSPAYLDSVLTMPGSEIHVTSRWLNDCVVLLTDSSQAEILRSKSFIKSAVFIAYYPSGLHKPAAGNTKFSAEQKTITASHKPTGTALYYGQTYGQTTLVHGDFLHDGGYKGTGMLIAVLDAGFLGVNDYADFDSLFLSSRLLDKHNFVLDLDTVFDYDGHGTSVLSTMAAYVPGTFVGTAPMAQYALYITEDNNSEQPVEMDNMLAATERADSLGTDVVSVSLGYDIMDYNFSLTYSDIDGKSTVAAKAANIATQKGILFVASAGNDGGTPWHYVLTPGDADSALTVGAVYIDKTAVGFSGYGPNAGGRLKPDVCDLGYQVTVYAENGVIVSEDGTSFSTPQIAGWAACLWQGSLHATPFMIRNAIIKSADHYTIPDDQLGYGVPDFSKASQYLSVKDTPVDTAYWVTVSPNPFTSNIFVKMNLPSVQRVYFTLYDMTGRAVYKYDRLVDTWNNPNVVLPAGTGISKGIYILKVSGTQQTAAIKLFKN